MVPIAGGIALLVVGAILRYALVTGTVHGINLHIVGVILMLAGLAGLLLPRLVHSTQHSNRPLARSLRNDIDHVPQGYVESRSYDSSLDDDHKLPDGRRPGRDRTRAEPRSHREHFFRPPTGPLSPRQPRAAAMTIRWMPHRHCPFVVGRCVGHENGGAGQVELPGTTVFLRRLPAWRGWKELGERPAS